MRGLDAMMNFVLCFSKQKEKREREREREKKTKIMQFHAEFIKCTKGLLQKPIIGL